MKTLSAHYPPLQVATLRGLSSLPLVLAWVLLTTGLRPLLRIRWALHLLRGALGIVMMGSFVYALKRLPLSTAYSIFFVAPLLITALSVPILGEKVGPRRWTAIAVGLLGVLTVLRPTGAGVISWAGLAVLVAALAYAVSAITVRVLARTDSNQAMVFWMLVMMALGAGVLAWPGWVPLRPQDAWVIAGSRDCRLARPIHDHRSLPPRRSLADRAAGIHRAGLGRGAGPGACGACCRMPITWLGAAIIIASGLYLLRRERVHAEAEHP